MLNRVISKESVLGGYNYRRGLSLTCFIFIVSAFVLSFLYLHQRVNIYVEAYRLSKQYQNYNELVDRRDFLKYNFIREVSIVKVNQWAEGNNFLPVEKARVVALNIDEQSPPGYNRKLALLFNHFWRVTTDLSKVLAKDR